EEYWRNDIGSPVVMLRKAANGVHAITSQAALFELDRAAIGSGSTRAPIENAGAVGVTMRFEDPLPINDQSAVLVNRAGGDGNVQIAVYDASRGTEKIRLVSLNLASGAPSGRGLVAGGGLFLPMDSGRSVVMDYQTGQQYGSPFQPVSNPVGKVQWTNTVRLPDDESQVVLADSRKGLYRLRVGDRLNQLAKATLESPTLGTLAAVGSTVMAATSGPASDFVIGHNITTLKEQFKVLLDGRVIWGPANAGQVGILLTDDQMLRGIRTDGTEAFAVSVPQGLPVGEPLLHNGQLILVSDSGWVVSIDATTGERIGLTDVGQPFSAQPMVLQNRLLIPGDEGVVYVIEIPAGESE
ncbi:MAG: PQQ-binding-like beta-propeller repeat protein, partial [Planctomycetota bacterium]